MYPYNSLFDYSELIGREFYYIPQNDLYSYGDISNRNYTEISVVLEKDGKIYTLQYDEKTDTLSGVYLETSPFTYSVVYLTRQGEKDSEKNGEEIIDGVWVGIVGDMSHYAMINIDQSNQFMNNMIWLVDDLTNFDPKTSMPMVYSLNVTCKDMQEYVYGYRYSASQSLDVIESDNVMKMKIVGILRAKSSTNFGSLQRGVYYTNSFGQLYLRDALDSSIVNDENFGILSYIGSEKEQSMPFNAYVTFSYYDYSEEEAVLKEGYASSLNASLTTSFTNLFGAFNGQDNYAQDREHLRILAGIKVIESDGNLSFKQIPKNIKIYPYDFNAKDNITFHLNKWNESGDISLTDKTLKENERSEITYKDTIELIVSVINTLVDTITIALVAFTSLSLVVSCFMIAVITYISVMERVKEIGVIRSLGGRKKDVSRLFIAENLITGLASGIFGILITLIICIIINIIVSSLGISNIGALTWKISVIMISLSVFLSVTSGLIPSVRSSNQDPVIALRSE